MPPSVAWNDITWLFTFDAIAESLSAYHVPDWFMDERLGIDGPLSWRRTKGALVVEMPAAPPCDHASTLGRAS